MANGLRFMSSTSKSVSVHSTKACTKSGCRLALKESSNESAFFRLCRRIVPENGVSECGNATFQYSSAFRYVLDTYLSNSLLTGTTAPEMVALTRKDIKTNTSPADCCRMHAADVLHLRPHKRNIPYSEASA
jgi:hypothetical protein